MTLSPPGEPAALAHVSGGPDSPVSGLVAFFPHELGTLVTAQIHGLPYEDAPCSARIFGFHIHDGSSCTPPDFQDAGGHLNPADCPHPYHAGDLPPLFSSNGQAYMAVLSGRFRLGIIRYRVQHEAHFLDFLDEKELTFEQVWEYDYEVLLSRAHPLANEDPLDPVRLEDYIELTHGDKTVPHLASLPKTAHRPGDCENRRILIYERADQFEILSRIPTTYMWTSPEPRAILEQWGLVQKKCASNRRYRDVLIYPRRYNLTEYDRLFIDKLFDARNDIAFGNR